MTAFFRTRLSCLLLATLLSILITSCRSSETNSKESHIFGSIVGGLIGASSRSPTPARPTNQPTESYMEAIIPTRQQSPNQHRGQKILAYPRHACISKN